MLPREGASFSVIQREVWWRRNASQSLLFCYCCYYHSRARARYTQNKRKQSVICQILVARDKTAEILTPPHLSTDTGPMLPLWSSPLERAGSALWYFVYLFNCLPSGWLLWEPPFDAWSKACSAEFDRCTPQLLFTLIRAGSRRFALKVCSCQMSAVCCRTRFSFRYKHLGSCEDSRARR